MKRLNPQTASWMGALTGLLLALLLFAPARWLAQGVNSASAGQVQLVNARGSVWQGQADLLLTGGEGSRTAAALPQGIRWQLRPVWATGSPALSLQLQAPCCTPQGLGLLLRPLWGGAEVQLLASRSQWPADVLVGLGTPWNTLQLESQLALQTDGLQLRWLQGRPNIQGRLTLDAQDLASRLSRLRPLGSYRLELQAAPDGHTATLNLSTQRGELLLQGQGQWVGGRLRFQGQAEAAPQREEALNNLLNIMGRRQGTRSVFSMG